MPSHMAIPSRNGPLTYQAGDQRDTQTTKMPSPQNCGARHSHTRQTREDTGQDGSQGGTTESLGQLPLSRLCKSIF